MNPALSLDTPRPLKEYAPSTLELLKAIRREGFLGWMTNTWRQQGDLLRVRMGSQYVYHPCIARGGDVVDHRATGDERCFRHLGLAGIDGDGNGESRTAFAAAHKRFDHRQHTRQLFGGRNTLRSRARRFAADVDDIGAFRGHRVRLFDGGAMGKKTSAIGK